MYRRKLVFIKNTARREATQTQLALLLFLLLTLDGLLPVIHQFLSVSTRAEKPCCRLEKLCSPVINRCPAPEACSIKPGPVHRHGPRQALEGMQKLAPLVPLSSSALSEIYESFHLPSISRPN